MPINTLAELYNQITYSLSDEGVTFLNKYFVENLQPHQIQALTENESTRYDTGICSLLHACINTLNDLVEAKSLNTEKYDAIREVVIQLIKHLPFELLNKPQQHLTSGLFGPVNAFTLVLDHLSKIYRQIIIPSKAQYFFDLSPKWFELVCLPLMKHNVNVDVAGWGYGNTNLIQCVKNYMPNLRFFDPMSELFEYILKHTSQIKKTNNFGQNALYVAIMRGVPGEHLQTLINNGLDVNIKCLGENTIGSVRSPLLSHCVREKKYGALKLLLSNCADPNAMAEKETKFYLNRCENDPIITPYQLAVDLEDEEAIEIFIAHSNEAGIPLLTDMDEKDLHWNKDLGNLKLNKGGTHLKLNCKHRLFRSTEHLLENINSQFGIRCYVASPDDRQNVSQSLTWLATDALNSPLQFIWKPIYRCLVKKMQEDSSFAIYISSIPEDVTKKKTCQGLMHKSIYANSGLSANRYKSVLAHEAAHLFDQIHLNINPGEFQWGKTGEEFVTALQLDFANLEKQSYSGILSIVNEIKSVYEQDYNKKPFKEYFAYLLVSNIFDEYIYFDSAKSEVEIIQKFEQELSNTYKWFKQYVLDDVMEVESCASATKVSAPHAV